MHYVQTQYCIFVYFCSRPPHGGRGLKSAVCCVQPQHTRSPSPRRAWIEISVTSHSVHSDSRRPPHGGRGLKSADAKTKIGWLSSPSPRRAWIEMTSLLQNPTPTPSPSPRRAWIEIPRILKTSGRTLLSPSPRRAWIEIILRGLIKTHRLCRPPHGGRGLKYRHWTR